MEIKIIKPKRPQDANIIIGQAHFIKSVEDIYECLVSASSTLKFGLAFCESSGPCLVRCEGNDPELIRIAAEDALNVGAGHTFFILLREGFPINILNNLKMVPEVCRIFCATANEVEVAVVQTQQGKGILGVIDGSSPKAIEEEADVRERMQFLRKIGYKR